MDNTASDSTETSSPAPLNKSAAEDAEESLNTLRQLASQSLQEYRDAEKDTCPELPDWLNPQRQHFDYAPEVTTVESMEGLPFPVQEKKIIQDMLYCLSGIDSRYFRTKIDPLSPQTAELHVLLDGVDPGLKEMAGQIKQYVAYLGSVNYFIASHWEFGKGVVCVKLACAMSQMIEDYYMFLAKMETLLDRGDLSCQTLFFYGEPFLETLQRLSEIAIHVMSLQSRHSDSLSGDVLSYLHSQLSESHSIPYIQDLYLSLLQQTTEAYFETVTEWMTKGTVKDPWNEFFLTCNERIKLEQLESDDGESQWEKKFHVSPHKVPNFLVSCLDKIVKAGKYLNVLRVCAKPINSPKTKTMIYSLRDVSYTAAVDEAYRYASETLLELLMTERDLMKELVSIKRFFLIDEGDTINSFLDLGEEELIKKVSDIVPSRLETFLDLAICSSVSRNDPYTENLILCLSPFEFLEQMSKILDYEVKASPGTDLPFREEEMYGYQALTMIYRVKWPITLVLSKKIRAYYQILFRHLFTCKYIERNLYLLWANKKTSQLGRLPFSEGGSYGFSVLQHMLGFLQNFEFYLLYEVFQPYWQTFLKKKENVVNIDDLLSIHTDFVSSSLKNSMLSTSNLLLLVSKLLDICLAFSKYAGKVVEDPEESVEDVKDTIARFDLQFSGVVLSLLQKITILCKDKDSTCWVNALHRLDINSYYRRQLQEFSCVPRLDMSVADIVSLASDDLAIERENIDLDLAGNLEHERVPSISDNVSTG